MPSALKQMGVVITVSVLLIPQAIGQARAVMEAQRLRGRAVRGLRSLAGLTVPVLAGALERSLQRAESLDARGFGSLDSIGQGEEPLGRPPVGRGSRPGGGWSVRLLLLRRDASGSRRRDGLRVCPGGLCRPSAGSKGPAAAATLTSPGRGGTVLWSGARCSPRRCWSCCGCWIRATPRTSPIRASTAPAFHPLGALAFLLLLAPALASAARNGRRREDEDD